jgi:predicted CoA-binding protein
VGLDTRRWRTAHQIASYLQDAGYRIVPVWFQEEADEVLGEKAYARIQDIPGQVDLVDVFVRSSQTDRVIDDAIAAGAKAIWLQVGIVNPEGLQRAEAAGLLTTQDRCTMVEHRKLLRGRGSAR